MAKAEIRKKFKIPRKKRDWYRTQAGRFANDKIFDEIVELGAKYRKSLRARFKSVAKSNRLQTPT